MYKTVEDLKSLLLSAAIDDEGLINKRSFIIDLLGEEFTDELICELDVLTRYECLQLLYELSVDTDWDGMDPRIPMQQRDELVLILQG